MTLAATKEPTLTDLYEQLEQALKDPKKPKALVLDEIMRNVAIAKQRMMGRRRTHNPVEQNRRMKKMYKKLHRRTPEERVKFRAQWEKMIMLAIRVRKGEVGIVLKDIPTDAGFAIVREVAIKHGVPKSEIQSDRKHIDAVLARQEISYRCRNETGLSLPQIAKRFKRTDHTTILYQIREWERRLRVKTGHSLKLRRDKNIDWSLVE